MKCISTGNSQLNALLGGGIEASKNTILVGGPGCGKSSLALEFITDQDNINECSAYICIDKKPERVMELAQIMNPKINHRIKNETLKFVEISFHDCAIDATVNELLLSIQLQLDALFNNFPIKRVIIDSILPFRLSGFTDDQKHYFTRELLYITQSFNQTFLCLLYNTSYYQSLWLDTDLISDQLIFHKVNELDYTTYWLEISKNKLKNKNGNYRFTFDHEKGLIFKHR